MLSEDSIREPQRSELGGKPTGADIIIIVNANNNIVPCIQRGRNSSQKVCVKERARIWRRQPLGLKVTEMLVPNRAQIVWAMARPVG